MVSCVMVRVSLILDIEKQKIEEDTELIWLKSMSEFEKEYKDKYAIH